MVEITHANLNLKELDELITLAKLEQELRVRLHYLNSLSKVRLELTKNVCSMSERLLLLKQRLGKNLFNRYVDIDFQKEVKRLVNKKFKPDIFKV